jgi:hypothetical protein
METKECTKCHNILPVSDFNISRTSNTKKFYKTYCKSCQKLYKQNYDLNNTDKHHSYYKSHKDYYIRANKEISERNKKFILEFKLDKNCKDCGINYPYYVLDFDHLHSKKENISYLIFGRSIDVILEEISKCDIVCSNCHRIRTYNRIIKSSTKLSMSPKNIAARNRISMIKGFVNSQKSVPCADCNITYPYYVMDFDHRNPDDKLFNISEMIYSSSFSKIKEEIVKCDVVCSNCHRIRSNKENLL